MITRFQWTKTLSSSPHIQFIEPDTRSSLINCSLPSGWGLTVVVPDWTPPLTPGRNLKISREFSEQSRRRSFWSWMPKLNNTLELSCLGWTRNSLVANRSVFKLFFTEKSNHFPLFYTELFFTGTVGRRPGHCRVRRLGGQCRHCRWEPRQQGDEDRYLRGEEIPVWDRPKQSDQRHLPPHHPTRTSVS